MLGEICGYIEIVKVSTLQVLSKTKLSIINSHINDIKSIKRSSHEYVLATNNGLQVGRVCGLNYFKENL
jgi:hypothetical protein